MTNDKQDDMKEFEEEFDFESEEPSTDALSTEEETLDSPKNTPASNRASEGVAIDRKPSKLPLLIGLVAASFIGWQGYKMMFGQPKDDLTVTEKQEAKPKTSKPTTTPTTLPDTAQHQPNKTTTTAPAAVISTPPGGNTVPSNMNTTSTQHHQPDLFTAPQIIPQQAAALTTPAPAAKPGQLETIEDSLKKSQERMNKLESKFSELMDSMGSLNQGMGQVTRELSTINDSVQKLNKDVKTLKSQAIQPIAAPQTQEIRQQPELDNNKYETKSTTPGQISSSTPTMSVHAIIPGRAWLKSKDGSTITVTEGDSLERYGKVLVIDASNGVVITSSGVTLR